MKFTVRHVHIRGIAPFFAAAFALHLSGSTLAQVAGVRPDVSIQCASSGKGPMLECSVKVLGKDGAPLNGASIVLGAMMPSMPMAHSVKPVSATATEQPGEYKGTLSLEMAGVWAVEVDISGPVRDKTTRYVQVMPCKTSEKCAAQNVKPGEQAVGHGSHGMKSAPAAPHKH